MAMRQRTWMAGLVLLALVAGAPAMASEVVLYDNANCAGTYRILIQSESDLDRIEFGNEAASVQVIAGSWTFYRDDDFLSGNGPPFTLSTGGCVNMGGGPAAQFPPELLDSVQLVQPAAGPGAAIVLFDQTGFQGSYRVLTGNTPDLDAMEFDNRLASFQVLAGAWRIFRDDGFQANQGPPIEAAGAVADIEQLGFPRDRASSVMRLNVASDPPPPPPPEVVQVECPPGSASNGAVCVDCVGAGLVVAADGGSCQCPPGQQTVGGRTVNGISVALCQRELTTITPPPAQEPDVQQAVCSGNSVSVGGGCVPCPDGAAPNATNNQCYCRDGFQQVGIEGTLGMPICSPSAGRQLVDYKIAGIDAFLAARNGGFKFGASGTGAPVPPLECNVTAENFPNLATVEYWPPVIPLVPLISSGHCTYHLFADRQLSEGWGFVSLRFADQRGPAGGNSCTGYITAILRDGPETPRNMAHTIEIHHPPGAVLAGVCVMVLTEVVLRGPVGADWRDAFR